MGNLGVTKRYAWGGQDEDGCAYVRNLLTADRSLGLQWAPREFRLVGVLQDGIECDFNSLLALSRTEPKALLVATDQDKYNGRYDDVLEVCRMLEGATPGQGLKSIGSMMRDDGLVLTFPTILDVCIALIAHAGLIHD